MRTLEEVIDSITKQSGLEIRDVRKPEKDRFWVDRETYNDALHYLREYQRDKQIFAYDIARRSFELSERNDPLTWDELTQMICEPVWLETKNSKQWGLNDGTYVDAFGNDCITIKVLHDLCHFEKNFIGITWNAYRKERHEDA